MLDDAKKDSYALMRAACHSFINIGAGFHACQ
jgi:hypothetical protein